MLERNEIKDALDKKMRENGEVEFDDEMIDAIFDNLDKDQNGRVSKDEFCKGYIDVENFFKETVEACKEKALELNKIKTEYEQQLQEAMRTEVVNKYGIMENSVLTASVIEARDLKPMDFEGISDPYVMLECSGQTCQTKYHKSTLNPIWEESFTFDIF